jgi:hypothetical protein
LQAAALPADCIIMPENLTYYGVFNYIRHNLIFMLVYQADQCYTGLSRPIY